jgi:preprotein translocase subunit SecE
LEVRPVLTKAKNFVDEVKSELVKVTWPTRKETIATTWVVVVIIFLISLYLGACDVVLAKLMRFVLR